MKKATGVFAIFAVLLVLLSACSGTKMSVADLSVSQTGDVSGSVTPNQDMKEVVVCVTAKNSEGKVNFNGEMTLPGTFSKNTKTAFSFNLFDTNLWVGAPISYNPFSNIYASFLKDNVTCQLKTDGKEIASFAVDTSKIDLQTVMDNLAK